MASLTAMRTGLATNLGSIAVADPTVTVSAYVLQNPTPPTIMVRPNPDTLVEYHQAFKDGVCVWYLVIEAYAGALSDVAAQQYLDSFCADTGSLSVKAAAESDPTLGGAAAKAVVTMALNYREYASPEGAWLISASWDVEVTAPGT